MNPDERKQWAINQPVTKEDSDNARELMDDLLTGNWNEDYRIATQWAHKIRVEGGLAVLSQIPKTFVRPGTAGEQASPNNPPTDA